MKLIECTDSGKRTVFINVDQIVSIAEDDICFEEGKKYTIIYTADRKTFYVDQPMEEVVKNICP